MKIFEIVTEFKAQTTQADLANAKQIAANVKQANAKGDAEAAMAAGAALGDMLMNKTMPDMIRFMEYAVRELEKACKQYANDPNWAEQCKQMPQLKAELAAMKKQAMQDGVALGRQDVGEATGPSGADMLAKVDMLLQNTGIKREGFKLVKDPAPQGSVRGSITQEAIDAIKATLAKAKAMGATEPVDPTPTINPADITDKDFGVGEGMYETTTASAIAVAPVGVGNMQSRSMRNKDGTIKNALDVDVNIMGGHKPKKNKKKA